MIGTIENAILNRIKAAVEANALGYHIGVSSYGGDFAQGIERATRHFPCVILIYAGGTLTQSGRSSFKQRHTFGVMCCARHLQNDKLSRHGHGSGVGSYQIVQDMLALLSGFVVHDEGSKEPLCSPLTPRAVRPLLNDSPAQQLASIYAIDFDVELSFEARPATGIDDFETFNANWDVPIHGNVSTELPADATADATDNVNLETDA